MVDISLFDNHVVLQNKYFNVFLFFCLFGCLCVYVCVSASVCVIVCVDVLVCSCVCMFVFVMLLLLVVVVFRSWGLFCLILFVFCFIMFTLYFVFVCLFSFFIRSLKHLVWSRIWKSEIYFKNDRTVWEQTNPQVCHGQLLLLVFFFTLIITLIILYLHLVNFSYTI